MSGGREASYVYLSVRLSVSPRVYRGRRRVRRRLTCDVSTDPTDRARRITDRHALFVRSAATCAGTRCSARTHASRGRDRRSVGRPSAHCAAIYWEL